MNKINFQNGTLISKAKVTINGTVYEVEPEEYEGTTPLNAENLNQMQKNAEDAIDEVGEALEETNQNIENLTTYSTTEQRIGTWINGKPLYRITFNGTTLPTTGEKKAEINISSLSISRGFFDVTHSYFHDTTNGRYYSLPVVNVSTSGTGTTTANSSAQAGIYFNDTFTKIVIEGGYNMNWSATVTIEYTKTTD